MTKHTKQIIAIAVLSIAIAVQSFLLASNLRRVTTPKPHTPAAVFNFPANANNPGRTLRPDGQREEAELSTMLTFSVELGSLCPELRNEPFCVDSLYVSPTAQTAKLILKRALRKLENVYVAEAYDCDDNATELMVLMRKESLVEYREYPAALAIGFVGVRIDGPIFEYRDMSQDPRDYPIYHAMVILRLKDGHWWLIEPLTHQVCELTGPMIEEQIAIELIYF